MAATTPINQPKKIFCNAGFTLAEILYVTVILAILAALIFPRFLSQTEKVIASEAVNIIGAIKRMEFQARDASPTNEFYQFSNQCTDANKLALKNLGLDLTSTCVTGQQKWTYKFNGTTIYAYRGTTVPGTGGNYIALNIDTNAWTGNGTFAVGSENWPNLK